MFLHSSSDEARKQHLDKKCYVRRIGGQDVMNVSEGVAFSLDSTDEKTSVYRCGEERRISGTGYTNLVNHVREPRAEQYREEC